MKNIKPYFVEDIEAQLKSVYFSTLSWSKSESLGAARLIVILCLAYGIKPDWLKPEHAQELWNETKG
jgi:hypothetical protein